jgi:hypothetical protein
VKPVSPQDYIVLADRSIAEGEARLVRMGWLLLRAIDCGHDATEAERTVDLMMDSLAAIHRHRDRILAQIAEIEGARLISRMRQST